MNQPILVANLLTLLAFFIHTVMGDRELKIIEPEIDDDEKYFKRENGQWQELAGIGFQLTYYFPQ